MKPTIGRIVHYVLTAEESPRAGEHRPAIVVRLEGDGVKLHVFFDGEDAHPPEPFEPAADGETGTFLSHFLGYCRGPVAQDDDTKAPGTWHWPERES